MRSFAQSNFCRKAPAVMACIAALLISQSPLATEQAKAKIAKAPVLSASSAARSPNMAASAPPPCPGCTFSEHKGTRSKDHILDPDAKRGQTGKAAPRP